MWAYSVEPVRARGLKHYWTMVFHYFCGSREFAGYQENIFGHRGG